MKEQAKSNADQKPCLCRVFSRSRLIWKSTGRQTGQGDAEFQCKLCGATSWRQERA